MDRKRLAAFVMTGCLFTTAGCSTTSSGSGLFSGRCCGHGSSSGSSSGGGLFSRMFGSGSSPSVAATPVSYGAPGVGGPDCPCSNQGEGGLFQPAIMAGGLPSGAVAGGMPITGDMTMQPQFPTQGMPIQQFPTQPAPVTTPGVPPNMTPAPGQPPRIQPVPMAPQGMAPMGMTPTGVSPSGAMAPAAPWGPR